ncbi:MAG: hypothetical protein A3C80_01110 [Candidatus Ryanbacteria bacterium RIFCSPHIGHO2_02_FULL_45_43]|uniref:Uncharacterized protein n=1 Tax=Candidatus Ryanbacteria bacterium RIFCSPHIGHO2_01_45_13 TaxID=1802112 RepID=A0A1G2FXT8_9BACT|nr:MAG: hypothetical protein A2718_03340 [Candidatus Ryanbacteria bacterium RIFCSPHIGHO2_01_FULL_44_130]OGZ42879.1 MAG: hypothetical protein A2W41_02035 [Candidatus Ryanbacteria bacterium RIFCSPHIGHO2_01_45_13]OGZ48127.1 MAG: hypothetical protein A3C80_01110 [Candidatus Ryanbacteria bacterium RIFCSPHIGHO2_02_FULL_45_43]OGZ49775.1 MAG: hypothetical protein A3E55_00935 [Candidatus Ryanbacteria bacterium RIFCSPHIGHO2_12_FULL_44_20]OGZ51201.1 MAG: hypothetical protein A3A17_04145 [Candidatus Ryanba
MWRSLTIGVLGVFVIAVPFVFLPGTTRVVVFVFVGSMITFLALWKLASEGRESIEKGTHSDKTDADDPELSK